MHFDAWMNGVEYFKGSLIIFNWLKCQKYYFWNYFMKQSRWRSLCIFYPAKFTVLNQNDVNTLNLSWTPKKSILFPTKQPSNNNLNFYRNSSKTHLNLVMRHLLKNKHTSIQHHLIDETTWWQRMKNYFNPTFHR